jgi:hypothetical protein
MARIFNNSQSRSIIRDWHAGEKRFTGSSVIDPTRSAGTCAADAGEINSALSHHFSSRLETGSTTMIRRITLSVAVVLLVSTPQVLRAAPILYTASLSGPNESPPNSSLGTGFAQVLIDPALNTMQVSVSFSGLSANTTASHIHSATSSPGVGTAGVATTTPTFPGFPLNVTSGTYNQTFDMTMASSYNPQFVANFPGMGQAQVLNAEAGLFSSIAAGTSYLNIHSTMFPGGEIRGFLALAVPEPASVVMMSTGFLGVITYVWKRKARSRA